MKPNLIYFFTNQLRYQSVGYNGDPYAATPNIDSLSKQSTIGAHGKMSKEYFL